MPGEEGVDTFAAESQGKPADATATEVVEKNEGVDTFAAETAASESRTTEVNADDKTVVEADSEKPGGDKEDVKPDPDKKDVEAVYEEFTVAEGQEMDKTAMDALIPIAKDLGLSQEAVQSIVDVASGMIGRSAEANTKLLDDQVTAWKKETAEHPEIGGLNLDKNLGLRDKFIERFGDEGLREFLEDTSFIHHPMLTTLLARAGAAISEDQMVRATGSSHSKPFTKSDFYASETK